MANPAYANFINRSGNAAKTLLELQGILVQLDTLWAGTPDYDSLITQSEIDEFSSFVAAGLTTTILGNAEFALAGIKTAINNALPDLTVLGNLP